jgi:hypothetical protein
MTDFEIQPDPTPILTLPPDEEEPEYTEEELVLKHKKEKAQKCKVIALNKMGHHPINVNVSNFNTKSKKKLLDMVKELFEKPDEEIQNEFNEVCLEVVFNDENNIVNYPVYKSVIRPIEQPKMDIAGNIIE